MELARLYTVPLSAVNGLSHLTKLSTSKGAGTADSFRKFSNQPITYKFESNLEASQVPTIKFYFTSFVLTVGLVVMVSSALVDTFSIIYWYVSKHTETRHKEESKLW